MQLGLVGMVPWPWDLVEGTLQLVCLPSTKMELAVVHASRYFIFLFNLLAEIFMDTLY